MRIFLIFIFSVSLLTTTAQTKEVKYQPDSVINTDLFKEGTYRVIDSTGTLVPDYELVVKDSIVTEFIGDKKYTITSRRTELSKNVYYSVIQSSNLPKSIHKKGVVFHTQLIATDTKNKIISIRVLFNKMSEDYFLYKVN